MIGQTRMPARVKYRRLCSECARTQRLGDQPSLKQREIIHAPKKSQRLNPHRTFGFLLPFIGAEVCYGFGVSSYQNRNGFVIFTYISWLIELLIVAVQLASPKAFI